MALIDTIKSHLRDLKPASEAATALKEQDIASRAAMEALGASTPSVMAPAVEETIAMNANDFLAAVEGTMEARLENHYGRTMRPATIHEACYYALEETIPEGLVPPEYDPAADLRQLEEITAGVAAALQADPDQPNPEENIENSTTIGDLSNAPQDIASEGFGAFLNSIQQRFYPNARMENSEWAERNIPKYNSIADFCKDLGVGNGFTAFKGDDRLSGMVNGLHLSVMNATADDGPVIQHAVKCVNQLMDHAVEWAFKHGTWDEEDEGVGKHSKADLRKLFGVETLSIYVNYSSKISSAKAPHRLELYVNDGNTYGGHVLIVDCYMHNDGRVIIETDVEIAG